MPQPGSKAQRVIDSAQPVLERIRQVARTERMRKVEHIEKDSDRGARFAAGEHLLDVGVAFDPDHDDAGAIYANFVFIGDDVRQAVITVAKDVVTGCWRSDFSIRFRGRASADAARICRELDISEDLRRDIGEERAWMLIERIAERVIGLQAKHRLFLSVEAALRGFRDDQFSAGVLTQSGLFYLPGLREDIESPLWREGLARALDVTLQNAERLTRLAGHALDMAASESRVIYSGTGIKTYGVLDMLLAYHDAGRIFVRDADGLLRSAIPKRVRPPDAISEADLAEAIRISKLDIRIFGDAS